MPNIIKAEQLPEGEKVYLKKGITGEWRVVHPWRNEDGSLNWFAIFFGSKGNLLLLILIMAVAAALYLGALELLSAYQQVAADPCSFCREKDVILVNLQNIGNFSMNVTK